MTKRRKVLLDLAGKVYGVPVATAGVCEGHSAPLDFLEAWVYDRPPLSVVHGPRGGGKSYLAALATHIESQRYEFHGTKILGGSLAQSQQIYNALRDFERARPNSFGSFTKTAATYKETGSEVSILAASATSVRGPHVPTLRLDEVDEIDAEIRDAAAGMCMGMNGVAASVSMTSTWHNVAGPMGGLRDRANNGELPWFTFCAFEILERCPDERSGPDLEKCPQCPLVKWCHDTPDPLPKAKRSAGHYPIDSLIQKVSLVSLRVFESDYLCLGPKADGVWFTTFDDNRHVTTAAEYNPALPVHVAMDPGVFTAAVWFQTVSDANGNIRVNVFADYLSEDKPVGHDAAAMLEIGRRLCNDRRDVVTHDPSGGDRTASGLVVTEEFRRAGFHDHNRRLATWPKYPGSLRNGLDLVDALLQTADGAVSMTVHPRCKDLINALKSFRRAKRQGQWQDRPEDPQHPAEDLVEALRGGLLSHFPAGRRPEPRFRRSSAAAAMY